MAIYNACTTAMEFIEEQRRGREGRGPKCNCTAPCLSRAALGLGHLGPSIDTRFKLNLNPLEGVRPGSDFIRLSSDWAASSSV